VTEDEEYAAGIALTEEIIRLVGPVVNGKPTGVVIEAFAAAMIGLLTASEAPASEQRLTLCDYAQRILDWMETIE
jgi:hypothetical protein